MSVKTYALSGEDCPTCSGDGFIEPGDEDGYAVTRNCPDCDGDGMERVEVVGELERLVGVPR